MTQTFTNDESGAFQDVGSGQIDYARAQVISFNNMINMIRNYMQQ